VAGYAVISQQGKEAIVAILDSGEFFGEGCLAGQPVRIAIPSHPVVSPLTLCYKLPKYSRALSLFFNGERTKRTGKRKQAVEECPIRMLRLGPVVQCGCSENAFCRLATLDDGSTNTC
jgi:hypothetical protein